MKVLEYGQSGVHPSPGTPLECRKLVKGLQQLR